MQMSPEPPVPAASGRDRAYQYLYSQVLVDPAMQGAFLSEQDIAERVGVSRTPVREALLLLASDGLVQMIPKRGVRVPVISGREIAELMELRGVLERHAATTTLAAGRVPLAAMRVVLARQHELKDVDPARAVSGSSSTIASSISCSSTPPATTSCRAATRSSAPGR